MLKCGIIGIGNCGNQIAQLSKQELDCKVVVMNTSDKDLETIDPTIVRFIVGDREGAGKNRDAAKQFLKDGITKVVESEKMVEFMKDLQVVFVVSSIGGGSGSGISPVLSKILRQKFRNKDGSEKIVILVGVLPKISEALTTQANALEYLTELYETIGDATYMLYDNETLTAEPTYQMMKHVNASIVQDFKILSCYYNTTTPYASIDDKDMKMILNTPGRIVVASLFDIKEKDLDSQSIEEMIIDQLKKNTHAELDRNKVLVRTGIISLLSEPINNTFDTHLKTVQQFIGSPVEEFEHVKVNADRSEPNNVMFIASGMSAINDRIRKINDRIDEINAAQEITVEESVLKTTNLEEIKNKKSNKKTSDANIDVLDLFKDFNV